MQSYFKWKTKQQNSSSGNRMDTNPVAGDEHIDEKIFWPALKRLIYKEKHRTMHTDNKEIVSLKLNKSDYWCMKKKYSPAD